MIDEKQARQAVVKYLNHSRAAGVPELLVVDQQTIETDFGWVFFYETETYLKSGAFEDMLLGNAPLIVDQVDGSIHETGTARDIAWYIENYRRFRSPCPPS